MEIDHGRRDLCRLFVLRQSRCKSCIQRRKTKCKEIKVMSLLSTFVKKCLQSCYVIWGDLYGAYEVLEKH